MYIRGHYTRFIVIILFHIRRDEIRVVIFIISVIIFIITFMDGWERFSRDFVVILFREQILNQAIVRK